ncbi:MAG: TlpA family protein disulfide reductase [Candidatus Rokubacteria bacterium]|nr:TlpA family protein disulfide reductase [Candidatus Rokubacteria bacterium]
MRAWGSTVVFGESWRARLARAAIFVLLAAAVIWALPGRKPGEEGGRRHHAPVALDPFERAGIVELKEGQRGLAFRLATLEGGSAALEDYAGKLVVLNFWATWCTPCEVEMPTLESLWQKLKGRGLVVVGVNLDRGAPRSLIEPYVRGKKLTFPILLDPDMATAQAWRVTGLPATFLVKPSGEVAGMAQGLREWDSKEMLALLETLLPAASRPGH